MERRGRIPVAKFRTQEAKSRSRSRVREPDYNEQDPETDLFTLLEDNIALKEENKQLKLEIESFKKSQDDWQTDKSCLNAEVQELKERQKCHETQIKEFSAKCTKLSSEKNAFDKLHRMKVDIIENMTKEMEMLQDKLKAPKLSNNSLLLTSDTLKNKLIKILPTLHTGNELESLVEVESPVNMPITVELVERLVDEFLTMKATFAAIELQLYEANEKVSELLEHQHQLEDENESLRNENENLTKVAKLLTENMKESVETSQKMEAALLKLKKRNDELVAKTRDAPDGPPTSIDKSISVEETTLTPVTFDEKLPETSEDVESLQQNVENQNRDHSERIVEMKCLIEAAIEKTTNAELKTLQIKLEILENELRQAIARAEHAESELEKYKKSQTTAPPPPPPLPPPLPAKLIFKSGNSSLIDSIVTHDIRRSGKVSPNGSEGVCEREGVKRIIDTVKQQVQHEAATGVDALVQELKSGRVTLRRRNRRNTNTNDALQEMFQVLEISQKQNRDSKICMDMNI